MLNFKKIYPSKLLLFGEYTVTQGSSALAIPLQNNYAHWKNAPTTSENQEGLVLLLQYLSKSERGRQLINIDQLESVLSTGVFLESNIPQGYGLGSSGSVVASVYDAFCTAKTDDLIHLKKDLSFIENAFHGNSSGIDPMVSYLNSGLVITKNGCIEQIQLNTKNVGFFLIDTGVARKTTPLVSLFEDKISRSIDFKTKLNELTEINNSAIQNTLTQNLNSLWEAMCQISKIQSTHFNEMILPDWLPLWEEGLISQEYALKLCGAGGGGMILGMYNPYLKKKKEFKNMNVIEL